MIPGCEVASGRVCLIGVQPVMARGAMKLAGVYRQRGYFPVITSAVDGVHSPTSLHYRGLALDFRTRTVPADERQALRDAIAKALGPDFDVVLESDHLHVEWDPKT